MASVYRKTVTRPLPPGAEIIVRDGERFARWKPRGGGRRRTAPIRIGRDGKARIAVKAGTWTAKYRDGQGILREKATGCRDRDAALSVLADLKGRAERVRSGVISESDDRIVEQQATRLQGHVRAYLAYLASKLVRGRRVSASHCKNVRHNLDRVFGDCGFTRLADLDRDAVQDWSAAREEEGLAARTRNAHLAAVTGFGNWAVKAKRLAANPFEKLDRASERMDRRRQRRALGEDELVRLLEAAHARPLREAMVIRRGPRKGELAGKVRPEVKARLERLGRERALIYKTLFLTGLRKSELASLTAGQLEVRGGRSWAVLDPEDEKNANGSWVALRSDLASEISAWLGEKLELVRKDAEGRGDPVPARLPLETPMFDVPSGLIRIFDRDLAAAGIPKKDDRGRTVDVHSLRTSFATHLSRAGVAPRTAQAALRHSSIDLTMNHYTDPTQLDVSGALDSLPPLAGELDDAASQVATAAAGAPNPVAPDVAPTPGHQGLSQSTTVPSETKTPSEANITNPPEKPHSPSPEAAAAGSELERVTRFERATFSLGS